MSRPFKVYALYCANSASGSAIEKDVVCKKSCPQSGGNLSAPGTAVELFISYAHEDEQLRNALERHLSLLRRQGIVTTWHDRQIGAGQEWAREIDTHLDTARVILLLVSVDFLASDYCYDLELRRAMERHERGEARVIPIILRAVDWQGAPFGKLQALPADARPVTSWDNPDEAFENVARGIRAALLELSGGPTLPVESPEAQAVSRIGTALDVLTTLMKIPEVQDAVGDFQDDLRDACQQIGVLTTYKYLHDEFQKLEDSYKLIYHAAKRDPDDPDFWEDLERTEPVLQLIADELLAFAAQAAAADEGALWTQRLDRARTELHAAVEQYDTEQLGKALGHFNQVLGRAPVRLNAKLVEAARALPLPALVRAMTVVRDSLARLSGGSVATAELEEFEQGVEELQKLHASLETLVCNHDALQEIDDELRRIEALLDDDLTELEDTWQDLKPKMQELCAGSEAEWARKLEAMGAQLESALSNGEPRKIRQIFRGYRSQESQSFHRVDRDLLTHCENLQKVGEPLASVLRAADAYAEEVKP